MKKNQVLYFFLTAIFLLGACTEDSVVAPVDSMENSDNPEILQVRTKKDVMDMLNSALNSSKVITGQHCGDGLDQNTSFYNTYVEQLANQTKKYIGLVGADVGFVPGTTYPIQTLIDHWNEGGLVSISWHADNPFTEGYSFRENSVEKKGEIDFLSLVKNAPESEARTNYRSELDKVATVLKKLQDAGVVVIWRPFHEMNGDWFWWGIDDYNNNQANEADYITLWQDMHDTFATEYGLENLLWAYASAEFFGWNGDVLAYYPGSDYVDIVGVDYYGSTPDFPDFDKLNTTGKITALTEAGPSSETYGNWDENELLNALKGKAAYFLQWHSWPGADVAIINNRNANTMMNDEDALTRDEL